MSKAMMFFKLLVKKRYIEQTKFMKEDNGERILWTRKWRLKKFVQFQNGY